MFQNILVPVDGSPTGLVAVEKAIGLAKAFGSAITLAHVIDPYPYVGVGADYALGQNEYMAAATVGANQALESAEAPVLAAGVACQRRVVDGHVVEDGILSMVTDLNIDLVVMGSHGRHGIEKLLLGSVTQRVLSHITVPVLVVRG